jgi:hypothetical protein
MAGRLLYRTRQFWHYLSASPASNDLDSIKEYLPLHLYSLFLDLSNEEQAHSINILTKLLENGEENPELLRAALLHDVGKSRFPLRMWERVFIVIAKSSFSEGVKTCGKNNPLAPSPGIWNRLIWSLKKPFMVAEMHPEWGAKMVSDAGGSPLLVSLIRRHQEELEGLSICEEDGLLEKLQIFDDES